ncbi:adenylate/guanylate cyclase domain-containing protein [Tistrella bauzanensis]
MVHGGREQKVVILFTDIRGSTAIAEQRPPMTSCSCWNAISKPSAARWKPRGTPNAFVGDEVMAIFGADESFEEAAAHALRAAGEIAHRLDVLNQSLTRDLGQPLRIGIGIHGGAAVVGRLGYGETRMLTAVGDTVHVARRLEELTKAHACLLVVSDDVLTAAGKSPQALNATRHEITVRGRTEPLSVHAVPADAVRRLND